MGAEEIAARYQRDSWTAVLCAMPIPAALVDTDGVVLAVNRWIETAAPGDQLLLPGTAGSTLRLGQNNTRWRVRPIDERESTFLATGEREDVGDHLLRKFFSSGDSLFVVYDQAGRIIQSNAAWESLLGYRSDEVFGIDSWTLLPDDTTGSDDTREIVERELRETGRSDPTFLMRRSDGTFRLVQWALHFDFSVGRCFGIGRDITEEDRVVAELERRATTDPLTGLANRDRLTRRLSGLLQASGRPALLYCDLDQFKVVNDSLGHRAGDLLLAKLARRLDGPQFSTDVLVARFGGDEFVVLIDDADADRARCIAERIIDALERPFNVANRSIHASMSIGIAVTGDDQISATELLGHADTAVYEAKRRGRGIAVLFDEQLRRTTARRFEVEQGLREALTNERIEAWFQPLVDLKDRTIIGAEALVRWRTDSGIWTPGQFLDVAEEASLMSDIGSNVMSASVQAAAGLIERNPDFTMSINASHNELVDAAFVDQLSSLTLDHSVAPSNILIEITEQTAISTDSALPILNELRRLGFKIALDDFGTGYSSLAHLRDLPIDAVKIDRSFVGALNTDVVTRSLTQSLINLGRALNFEIVMEGIETEAQAEAAETLGGTIAQGYLFHKPMELAALHELPLELGSYAHAA